MPARRRQRGESLVALMVGLVIAMISILAMLMSYRTMVAVSVPATRAAVRDGQAASALLTAQIELQQAGYGIAEGEIGTNVSVDMGGRRIVWRYRESVGATDFLCAGLQLSVETGTPDSEGIYLLPAVPCTDAASPPTWSVGPLLRLASAAVFFEPDDDAVAGDTGEVRSFDLSTARFRLDSLSCGPFGINANAAIRTLVVMEDPAPEPDVTIFSYCLTNT